MLIMKGQVWISRLAVVLSALFLQQMALAALPDCKITQNDYFGRTVCKNNTLEEKNSLIKEHYLNAQLMSNAPLQLLNTLQSAWISYARQCKTTQCIKQQFEQRSDDLVFLTTVNQSLSQHYIRVKKAALAQPFTHIQLQQLDKNRIKIEGIQYHSPNMAESKQVTYLRAYTSPDHVHQITDLESKCIYRIKRHRLSLELESDNKSCQQFVGIYRIYD